MAKEKHPTSRIVDDILELNVIDFDKFVTTLSRKEELFAELNKKIAEKAKLEGKYSQELLFGLIDDKKLAVDIKNSITSSNIDLVGIREIQSKTFRKISRNFNHLDENIHECRSFLTFINIYTKMRKFLDPEVILEIDNKIDLLIEASISRNDPWGVLIESFCQDNCIRLRNSTLNYKETADLKVILNEVLVSEVYYFKSERLNPVIVDGGSNIGLSIFYFKTLYPESRIIAFEPNPTLFNILQKNVSMAGWTNVELYPYALSSEKGTAEFYEPKQMPMGGSLNQRISKLGYETDSYEVKTVVLNDYLNEPVDFLKLDIEGPEDAVIVKLGDKLADIKNSFIEFHHSIDLPQNRLVKILAALTAYGHIYRIDQALLGSNAGNYRPTNRIAKHDSLSIWSHCNVADEANLRYSDK